MSWARRPRPMAAALGGVRMRAEPRTLLGAVQGAWAGAVGSGVAAEAEPVAERDGVVTVACRSATWAEELDLLQGELLARLNRALGERRPGGERPAVRGLRFTAGGPARF